MDLLIDCRYISFSFFDSIRKHERRPPAASRGNGNGGHICECSGHLLKGLDHCRLWRAVRIPSQFLNLAGGEGGDGKRRADRQAGRQQIHGAYQLLTDAVSETSHRWDSDEHRFGDLKFSICVYLCSSVANTPVRSASRFIAARDDAEPALRCLWTASRRR